ncbi:MAG: hypothetical protein ACUZ8E_09265, partial [Candidatus Anammoxibacter sp.]
MLYFAFAIELLAIVFLSYVVERLWVKYINSKILKFFLFPGSVAHVLSHALLCLVTGATIKNLNIFDFKNNEIQYVRPKIRYICDFLIVVAPIFGCGIILLFLASHLGSSAGENQHISTSIGWKDNVNSLAETVRITLETFWSEINHHEIAPSIFIFVSIIFTVSMAPKSSEFKFLILGLITAAVIPFLLEMAGVSLQSTDLFSTLINGLWHLITLSISVLGALLCITLVIVGLVQGFKLVFSRKSKGQ